MTRINALIERIDDDLARHDAARWAGQIADWARTTGVVLTPWQLTFMETFERSRR